MNTPLHNSRCPTLQSQPWLMDTPDAPARATDRPPSWRQHTKRTAWVLWAGPLLAGVLGDTYCVAATLPLAVTSVVYHERGWAHRHKLAVRLLDRLAIAWASLFMGRWLRDVRSARTRRMGVGIWCATLASFALSTRFKKHSGPLHSVCHYLAALCGLFCIALRQRRRGA